MGKSSRNDAMMELSSTVEDEKTREYIQKRLLPLMQWYADEASAHMRLYRGWSIASLVASASIPVVSIFSSDVFWTRVLIAVLGAVVTFISAYLMLFDAKNVWINCRDTRETLNSIFYQYYTGMGIFESCENQQDKNARLIDVCEDIINKDVRARMSNYGKSGD